MTVDTRQLTRHFFLTGNSLRELIVCAVALKCCFPDKTAAFNAEMLLCNRQRISATHLLYLYVLDPLSAADDELRICRRAQKVAIEAGLFTELGSLWQRPPAV